MPFTINPFTDQFDYFATSEAPAGEVDYLSGNSGGMISPDSNHNINVVGDPTKGITSTGVSADNTITFTFSSSTDAVFAFLDNLNVGNVTPDLNYDLNIQEDAAGPIGMSIKNSNTSGGAIVETALVTSGSADIDWVLGSGGVIQWAFGLRASDNNSIVFSVGGNLGTGNALRMDGTTGQITITNAYTLPTTDGAANSYLGTNGSGTLSFSVPGSLLPAYIQPGSYPYTVQSTDYFIGVNTSAARTILLPNAPETLQVFVIKDLIGLAASNNITITTPGGTVLIDGATSQTISQNRGAISYMFNGAAYFGF